MSATRRQRKPKAPYLKPEPVDELVPVKLEPSTSQLLPAQHDLPYITPADWTKEQFIDLIVHNVLVTVSPKFANGTNTRFATITSYSGETSLLPTRYHLPVLWCIKRTWAMLRDAVVDGNQWKEDRYEILHLARLIGELLRLAREAISSNGLDSQWRCSSFNSVLLRFKYGCFKLDPKSTAVFDAKSQKIIRRTQDILGTHWKRWLGINDRGVLSDGEMHNGVGYANLASGLLYLEGRYYWREASSISLQSVVQHLHQVYHPHLLVPQPQKRPLPRRRKEPIQITSSDVAAEQAGFDANQATTFSRPATPPRPPRTPPPVSQDAYFIQELVLGLQPLMVELGALRQDIRELQSSQALYRPPSHSRVLNSDFYVTVDSNLSA